MKSLVSVAGKELTGSLSLLDATLMKNRGEGGCYGLTRNPIRIPGPEREQRADRVKTWKQIDNDGKEVGARKLFCTIPNWEDFTPSCKSL